jgi:hypothetical protein
LVLNGEIVSASEFDTYGTSLFIHYFVELPVGWSQASDENSDASGMTQTCKMAPIQVECVHLSKTIIIAIFRIVVDISILYNCVYSAGY